jgi:hypothetical protein
MHTLFLELFFLSFYYSQAYNALLWLAKMADDRPPPFSPGYVLDPRVLLEAPAAAAARAVTVGVP